MEMWVERATPVLHTSHSPSSHGTQPHLTFQDLLRGVTLLLLVGLALRTHHPSLLLSLSGKAWRVEQVWISLLLCSQLNSSAKTGKKGYSLT